MVPSELFCCLVILLILNIRYSATSLGEDEDNIIVFSGTVFQEIVIWSPFRRSNGSNILHRLKKHEVNIYIILYINSSITNKIFFKFVPFFFFFNRGLYFQLQLTNVIPS